MASLVTIQPDLETTSASIMPRILSVSYAFYCARCTHLNLWLIVMVLHAKSNIYVLHSVTLPTITVNSFFLRYFMNSRFAFLSLSVHCTNVNIYMLQWDIVRSITFLFHLFFFYSTSLSIFSWQSFPRRTSRLFSNRSE